MQHLQWRALAQGHLGMSLVVGLMLGLGGAMLLDWMDQRIRSAAEIAAILDVPILGVLPHMLGEEKNSNRGQEVHINPKSEVAEAYRSIRTAIQFSNPDVKIKVLLVTSPAPGDGKTTVASNLAIVMAQGGRRVLLVDADMRRPMLHKMFSIGKKSGLNEVLSGRCALEDAILHSNTENLDLLPAGKVPSNPAELLHSDNFNSVLTALTEKYDQVIIDSPPVAPVTDARILTAICDATIFVLRADKTSRRVSEYAYDVLTSVGGSVLGLVINDVPVGRGEYGYYNGYSYYRYGYSQKNGSNKDSSDAETSHTNSQATSRKAIIVATASLSANGNGGAVGTPTTEREPDAHV
jgi:succinoglycan biosynthesis transport protein ExoP